MSATTCTWAIAIEQTIDTLTAPTTKKSGYINDMDKYFYDVGLVSADALGACALMSMSAGAALHVPA